MFRIGDFSRIARVSARLLRFYDEIGLFTPAHADPQTGYRYYTVAQLAQFNRILVLKDLGFNLDQVRDILRSKVSAAELRNMLLLRRNDVEQTLAVESQRLHRIETRIAQLESEGALSADDVVVRAEPMRRAPFAETHRAFVQRGPRTDSRTAYACAVSSCQRGAPPTLIAIAHSPQFEQDEIDVEFGYVLEDGFDVGCRKRLC